MFIGLCVFVCIVFPLAFCSVRFFFSFKPFSLHMWVCVEYFALCLDLSDFQILFHNFIILGIKHWLCSMQQLRFISKTVWYRWPKHTISAPICFLARHVRSIAVMSCEIHPIYITQSSLSYQSLWFIPYPNVHSFSSPSCSHSINILRTKCISKSM